MPADPTHPVSASAYDGNIATSVVPVVIVADNSRAEPEDGGVEGDTTRFFDYLQSPQGHEIAKAVVGIVQDVKKAALSDRSGQSKLEKLIQVAIVLTVIVAASVLAAMDKLGTPVGILFGTLVGYVFGRKSL